MSFLNKNGNYQIQVVHILENLAQMVESVMLQRFITHGQDTKMNLFGELLGLLKPLEVLLIWLEVNIVIICYSLIHKICDTF